MSDRSASGSSQSPSRRLRVLPVLLVAIVVLTVWVTAPAASQETIDVDDAGPTLAYPDSITFSARVASDAPLELVVLAYGVEKRTCGTVTAKAFPEIEEGATTAEASWTWDMRQSGTIPPGVVLWYRWYATDAEGNEYRSQRQEVTWLDDGYDWNSLTRQSLTVHWYDGSNQFAEALLSAGVDTIDTVAQQSGITPTAPIDLYIYADSEDMRDVILYEPGWTGGLAFSDYDTVIIGIAPEQIEWGTETVRHELAHVLVGQYTFSCLSSVPSWLNEGIAVNVEGELDSQAAELLQAAIDEDALLSVRALTSSFSEHRSRADLSYAESYSLVNFLIAAYGPEQLTVLLQTLRDGTPIEEALQATYGFGLDGLEDRWREALGAAPRNGGATPTATVLPTPVPTYRPLDAGSSTTAAKATTPVAASAVHEGETFRAAVASTHLVNRRNFQTDRSAGLLRTLGILLATGAGVAVAVVRRK